MTGKSGPFLAILTALVTFFSAITPARATSDGLIAHWQFDETIGTTAVDSKGGNDGTLVNGPVWATGKIGGAVDFDGVDDFVAIPGFYGIFVTPETFTLSMWVNPDSFASSFGLLGCEEIGSVNCSNGVGNNHNYIFLDGTTVFGKTGNSDFGITSSPAFVTGSWQHLVLVREAPSGNLTLYRNGVLSGTGNEWGGVANGFAFDSIGIASGASADGKIDDVRIYNRALSAAEVQALYNTKYCAAPVRPEGVMFYNACCKTYQFCNGTDWVPIGSAPHCTSGSLLSNLIAHWKLDESSGTTAADSVGSNNGTLTNGPVWQSSGGHISGALSFDGINDYLSLPDSFPHIADGTISLWVKTTNDSSSTLFGVYRNSPFDTYWLLQIGNGASSDFTDEMITIYNTDGAQLKAAYTTSNRSELFDGSWHHIVVTDDTAVNLYLDGSLKTLQNLWGNPGNNLFDYWAYDSFKIGAQYYNNTAQNFFTGLIDDVRIYDRALSAAEVGQIYNGTDMCP